MALIAVLALTAWACGGGDDDDGGGDGGNGGDVTDACGADLPGNIPGLPDAADEAGEGDFPDDLPIYDGADFECGFSGETDGSSGMVGIWSTGDSVDDVKAFYDGEFSGDGPWTSESDGTAAGSSFWTITHEDDAQSGFVTVLADGDNTAITIIVGDEFADGGDGGDTPDDAGERTPDDSRSGSSDLPDEAELPDDFPSDIPLPDGARVTNASSFTSGGVTSHVVEIYSQDSIDDLASFFQSEFEGQGWTQTLQTESNGEIFASYADEPDATGTLVTISITESGVEGYNLIGLSVTSQ
jgi:hypothetical protein